MGQLNAPVEWSGNLLMVKINRHQVLVNFLERNSPETVGDCRVIAGKHQDADAMTASVFECLTPLEVYLRDDNIYGCSALAE